MFKTYIVGCKWIVRSVVFLLTLSANSVFAEEKQGFKVALSRAPITMDSRYATDAASIRLLRILSGGLVKLNKDFLYEPDIAKDYTNHNFQTYTFTLPNIHFSDGEKLTAQHIKTFYESIMSEGSTSPLAGLLADVERITTPDLQHISFVLKKKNPWFLTVLETPIFKINTEGRIEHPVGLSNLKFIKKSDTGDVWIEDGQRTIQLQVVQDPTVRVLKLMRGEVDVVYNDLPDELLKYTTKKGYDIARQSSASYTYMGFNLESGITANRAFRKALAYAIDREKIMQTLLQGNASLARSLLLDSHPAVYPAEIESYNPEKAIEILDGLGENRPEKLHLSVTTNPFVLRIAQVIQQQLKAVGIDMEISSSEWGSFYGNIKKGNFESYILTWVGRFQPDIFRTFFHSDMKPPHGANRGRYHNAEMDTLLDGITHAENKQEIYENAIAVQKLQEAEKIYLPLWRRDHSVVMAKNISGCEIPSDGGYEGLLACTKQ
jgi:peptide/nickel transport system substrate-binding protein